MAVHSSSTDLHPSRGARFAFERAENQEHTRYQVTVYLADGRTIRGLLAWPEGRAVFEDDAEHVDDAARWAREETLKLARAVRASGHARLSRWRA